jgi:hypothetical protein
MRQTIFTILLLAINLHADDYGSLLFHGNCTTCHFEEKTVSAPAVIDFKKRYMTAFPKKEEFVDYMAAWVKHPSEETSIMRDAIEKHGLMPELGFELDTLQIIAKYIYETDFTKKHSGHTNTSVK